MAADFDGRVCVVTGAASGLGRETAMMLAKRGADLILVDRDNARLCALADAIDAHAIALDVTDSSAVTRVFEGLRRVDVLINSAGTEGPRGALHQIDPDALDAVLALNVRGSLVCAQGAARAMKATGRQGAIVNIASTAAMIGSAQLGVYAMSKAAVVSMTKSLALALAADGIRVNAVCPGSIDGEMLERTIAGEARATDRERLIGLHPLGRFGTPGEVAETIVFLASDAASYITGVALPVDGGRLA